MAYWFIRSPFETRKWEDVLVNGVFRFFRYRNAQNVPVYIFHNAISK